MAFTGCSHVTIHGGVFSAVGGDQHNNNHIPGNLVRVAEGQQTALAQFHELKVPNIRLKRKIAESPVIIVDTRGWMKEIFDARRIIHAVSIRGEDKDEEFLHVQYTGPDAVRAYEHDFKTFSTVKDVNWVELFGYIAYSALPALVFYDALVPVSHIFERNGFSCMLQTYLCYSAKAQGVDAFTRFRELWVNPGNGTFHRGPYVADSSNLYYNVWSWSGLALPGTNHPSLDLQAFSNTNLLFQYLIAILPVHNIIAGIRWSRNATPECPNMLNARIILSYLPGTIYHRTSREIIVRYPGERERWYYCPWKERFLVPEAMRENTTVMDDRSVRFMLTPADVASLESFELRYDLQPGRVWNPFADSWLSQAHGIFSQLGIEESEWGEYSILGNFWLYFEQERDNEGSRTPIDIPTSTPIYFFIRPVPRPSDDESGWDDWLGGGSYYWSYDSAGKEEVPEGERRRLGLPSFRTTFYVVHRWWDRDAYDAIEMVNHHEGFDPVSLDLARFLDCLPLEVVGRNTLFEEVKDDNDEIEDMVGITSSGGSICIAPPMNLQSRLMVDVDPRPRKTSNFTKSWIRRLKAKFAQRSGRRKQKLSS